ncbi:unnamed protein product [Haemonchus placei]|uniref:MARVEL domain-containing protein n=1 Tax=Haemonchus placei TaxID=6290 RepID=A0A0N4W2X6_HAEPC|nr:unnamed protein product [Haemonchus placei]
MAKQDFETIDYFGPVVVAAIFAVALFLISFFIINFFCITKYDDVTQFEKVGLFQIVTVIIHSAPDFSKRA